MIFGPGDHRLVGCTFSASVMPFDATPHHALDGDGKGMDTQSIISGRLGVLGSDSKYLRYRMRHVRIISTQPHYNNHIKLCSHCDKTAEYFLKRESYV